MKKAMLDQQELAGCTFQPIAKPRNTTLEQTMTEQPSNKPLAFVHGSVSSLEGSIEKDAPSL